MGGTSQIRARAGAPLSSRKAMLETLVRHLSMVRLSIGAAAMVALVGCTGLIDSGSGGGGSGSTPEEQAAKLAWQNKALPVFRSTCVACHAGTNAAVAFLSGASDFEIRDTLLASPVVNLDAPGSSRVLTKGPHDGPELRVDQATAILAWLKAEKAAVPDDGMGSGGPTLDTEPFSVQPCTSGAPGDATCPINTIGLDGLGLPGAKIQFVAPTVGSLLYLNNLALVTSTDGAYLEHMLFVSHPAAGEPLPDTIDRYFNMKLNAMPATTTVIDGGTAAFASFSLADPLSLHFKVVKPYQSDTGSGSGSGSAASGCKDLMSFKTNAQQAFAAAVGAGQACASCHNGQNMNATSAMALTGINATDDAQIQLACNQIRTRVNFQNIDQSGVYLAPDPGNNNHPFRFSAADLATFKSRVNVWINAEKVAP